MTWDDFWYDVLEPQWLDLVILSAFFVVAMIGFLRKSPWIKYVTLAASLVYLGLYKSTMLSVVDIFRLFTWNLPAFREIYWYLFAGFALVTTIVWGRVYCGRICAFGALTQLMDRVVPKHWRYDVPIKYEKRINNIKYGVLAGVLVYYLVTSDIFIFRFVEPFWLFSLPGWEDAGVMWIVLGVLLLATVFVRNLYCRFLCPTGAFLGVISQVTTLRPIARWKECNTCKLCEKVCEWGAIRGPKIVKSECVRCDDCERLYADQKKCPHWLILLRKKPEPQAVPPYAAIKN
ncbi:MAG TPA: 4Fe-4S binding protein [Vicinamibacterales bacterium]|nr:4Fe-4S binding protein [Vicinamibacterales bacterium]